MVGPRHADHSQPVEPSSPGKPPSYSVPLAPFLMLLPHLERAEAEENLGKHWHLIAFPAGRGQHGPRSTSSKPLTPASKAPMLGWGISENGTLAGSVYPWFKIAIVSLGWLLPSLIVAWVTEGARFLMPCSGGD